MGPLQVDGQFPAGVSVDPATLLVSGTPLESGFFNVVFQFTDADGATLRQRNGFAIVP